MGIPCGWVALPPGLHSMRSTLEVVLNGADDPGPPEQQVCRSRSVTTIPTQAETSGGSGFTGWCVLWWSARLCRCSLGGSFSR